MFLIIYDKLDSLKMPQGFRKAVSNIFFFKFKAEGYEGYHERTEANAAEKSI